MAPHVTFWFDPVCPFAWMTSKWVRTVAELRGLDVDWRFISLRVLNAQNEDIPPEYRAGHLTGARLLRLAAQVRAEHGNEAVGRLYAAYGDQLFETEGATTPHEDDGVRRDRAWAGRQMCVHKRDHKVMLSWWHWLSRECRAAARWRR